MIQISTDRTKLLGEIHRSSALIQRISIIGWQLNAVSNLQNWAALKRAKHIKGYHEAIYSGLLAAKI